MGRFQTFAAYVTGTLAVALVAGCTSSSGGSPTTAPPSSTPATTPVSTPISTPDTSPTHSSIFSGPPHPPQPTLPADVPTTGPNTRPGEKPPIMPLEATQHTARGAKAFAAFFIKTIDWGFATVSPAYIRHYSAHNCDGCRAFADGFAKAGRKHHRYIGGRIHVKRVLLSAKPQVKDAQRTALVKFDISSFEEVDQRDRYLRADGAHIGETFNVSVAWHGNSWQVIQLTVTQ